MSKNCMGPQDPHRQKKPPSKEVIQMSNTSEYKNIITNEGENSNTLLVGVQQQSSEYEQRKEFLKEAQEEYTPLDDPEYNQLLNAFMLAMREEEDELEKERRKLRRKGLVRTYAYHCNRCNYVWLPKDFDDKSTDYLSFGLNIEDILRPKSCARCKSKFWNLPSKRKTKHNSDSKNPERWTKSRMKSIRRKWLRLTERIEQGEREFHKQMEREGIEDESNE